MASAPDPAPDVTGRLAASFAVLGFSAAPEAPVLASRVAELAVVADPVLAARAAASARALVRTCCEPSAAHHGVPVRSESAVAAELAAAGSLLVAASALSVVAEPSRSRTSLAASAGLLCTERPADGSVVSAVGLLAAALGPAARTEAAQLAELDSHMAVSPQVISQLLRRAGLVCAHTEPSWAVVSAAGWLVGVASTVAGVPADPAGCAFELRTPFDAASAHGSGAPTSRRGVPLQPPARRTDDRSVAGRLSQVLRRSPASSRGLSRPEPPRTSG